MSSKHPAKRVYALFSGRVQGVGFRYTVSRIAKEHGIGGYVENRWDGDVELVAEGSEQELMDFIQSIRSSPLGRNIVKDLLRWETATGEYNQFGISF